MNRLVRAVLNRILGREGERAAARYLSRRGYRIITRGYSTSRGEIDLIARDGDTLVFIEVKTRRAGEPLEAVTPDKQRRLTLAALHFLRRYGLLEQRCRIDVVAVHWPEINPTPSIDHVINAFEPPGRGQFFR